MYKADPLEGKKVLLNPLQGEFSDSQGKAPGQDDLGTGIHPPVVVTVHKELVEEDFLFRRQGIDGVACADGFLEDSVGHTAPYLQSFFTANVTIVQQKSFVCN
ncbi:MAG: hypothetical protein ACUVTO_03735, partial [Candidatus Caldatribacteriaceae bacterium]